MNRFKIEIIFVLALAVVTTICFFLVPINMLVYHSVETNYIFSGILYSIIGCLIAFNYYVLEYAFWLNLIMVILQSILARMISFTVLRLLVYNMAEVEKYQYKWAELFVIGVVMVLLSEVGNVVIRKFNRDSDKEE